MAIQLLDTHFIFPITENHYLIQNKKWANWIMLEKEKEKEDKMEWEFNQLTSLNEFI